MRKRVKSDRRLARRPLVGIELLEDRSTPAVAFALSGTNLLSFDTASPSITQTTAITNVTAGETLVGIDIRPQNGLLYGLGVDATNDTATLYTISTRTGVAGVVGSVGGVALTTDGTNKIDLPDPAMVGYGFDFNPAADRIRIVAGSLNFRANPTTGTGVDGDNTGLTSGNVTGTNPDGPINGNTTTVDAAGYTNSFPNNGGITTLYTLDASSDSLYLQAPPNPGTQVLVAGVTLGGNPLDFTAVNGFDLSASVTAPSSNAKVTSGSGLAILNVGGTTGLYSINLVDGTATFVGNVGNGSTAVQGLAIQNDFGGIPAIALDATGANLIRFNSGTPGTTTAQGIATGSLVAGETLVGIDFRPATGQLYALGIDDTANTGTLYLVDPQNGAVSLAVAGTGSAIAFAGVDFPAATAGYGFDFNPDVDRIRVTNGAGQNFRINPITGKGVDSDTVTAGTQPDGAINGSGAAGITGAAYTNSFGNDVAVTATTLYTLDAATDKLFIQNPPNNGTQSNPLPVTLGGNPLDFTDVNGFDIPAGVRVSTSNSAVTSGFGYAALTVSGTTSIYRIDLTTGAATNLGAIGAGATTLAGFALADAPAGTVAFTSATVSQSESGPVATVNLTRSGGTTGEVTVTVNVTGGTASAGADFAAGPYTATFADGATTASFTIALVDDLIFEGNETIVLTIASANNAAAIGSPNVATVTITENDAQQTFTVNAATGYALVGATLVPFASTNPGAAGAPIAIVGVDANETLVGIDFRPQNGQLYGLGVNATANTATLYAISTATGNATPLGIVGAIAYQDGSGNPIDLPDPATVNYDIDFNPAVDRLRVVAGALNFRVDPNTGLPVDGNTGVANINTDGSINGGTTTVGGTAYSNAFPNNGGVTTQHTLDAATNSLFIQNPPNAGTQVLVAAVMLGGNPLDFTAVKGFDILANVNAPASNAPVTAGTGLAVLTVGGIDSLYSIDLVTGAATLVGSIGATPATVTSVAFQSDLGATPTIALNAAGTALVRSLSNNVANPFTVAITGIVAGETLVGIDFRPQTGQLFGLGIDSATDTGTIYRIDPQTGAATAIAPNAIAFVDTAMTKIEFADPVTTGYGFDFNPTVDRIRITNSAGFNGRANPNDGLPVDTDKNGSNGINPDGNINGNGVVGISATAYTNAFGQSLTGGVTTQYTLDAASDSLYIQNPPNAGTQANPLPITLGGAPLDFSDVNGFNIPSNVRVATSSTPVTSGVAFAALTVGGVSGLYSINLATGEAALLGTAPAALSGLTTANTPAGIVEFTGATFSGNEANPFLDLTLTRTGGTAGEVSVTVMLTDGTTDGADYNSVPIVVTFADGATTATASVPITSDLFFEADETILVTLGDAKNGAVIGLQSTATATITNDDTAPTLSINNVTVAEGNAGSTIFTFTVSLSAASGLPVTVTFDTADGTATAGTDYTAIAGMVLTFAPGETSKTVDVTVNGDAVNEADETFSAVLSAPAGATILTGTGTGTITNDDAVPTLAINDVSVTEGNSGTTAVTFTINLTGATDKTVTVTVNSADVTAVAPGDYAALVGQTVTFAPGETTKTVTVNVVGDTLFEANETFTVMLSSPTNATISKATGTGTIANDDPVPPQNPLLVGEPTTAIGAGSVPAVVRTVDATGAQVSSTTLGTEFNGGVRVASGDVDGDGIDDIVVGTGPGGASRVRVLSGKDGSELFSVAPFEATFTGGVFVAVGDVTGDGKADVVISPDVGGGPRVRIFNGATFTQVADFFGINDPAFRGGARTAVGDVNGDGVGDLVVAAGLDGGPRISAIDGKTLATTRTTLFNDFFAFEQTLRDGAFIAVGDVNGDGFADIVAGGGPSGGPRVTIFDSQTLISSKGATLTQLANFFAGDPNLRTGVRVAVKDLDGDNLADVRTVVGGQDQVRAYRGVDLTPANANPAFTTLDGLPNFNGGVFVG